MLPYLQIYLKLADFWLWLQIEILNFRWQIFGSKTPKNGRFLTLTKKSTKIGRFSAIWLRFCRFIFSWVSQFWSHCSKMKFKNEIHQIIVTIWFYFPCQKLPWKILRRKLTFWIFFENSSDFWKKLSHKNAIKMNGMGKFWKICSKNGRFSADFGS